MMEEGEVDRRFTAGDLFEHWDFLSPAGRWEKVTQASHGSSTFYTLVWTDYTGEYGWFLPSSRKIHAVPPRRNVELQVRIVDIPRASSSKARILVVLAAAVSRPWPWLQYEELPIGAEHLGAGLGWLIWYRPRGVDDLVREPCEDKGHAKRRVKQLAKELAAGLKLPLGDEVPTGDLPPPPPGA